MAGNNSIQILRTTRYNAYEHREDANTLPGQPIYITDDNQLAIGGLDGNEGVPLPIGATSLHGYTSDINNGKISMPTSILQYNIAYNTSMSAMCYASGKHVFSGIDTPPWMNINSSEITLNTISSINSASSMQLRAVSGAYMVTGTSQLGVTPQNAYITASNFYLRPNSATTQGDVIEVTSNGVVGSVSIGQLNGGSYCSAVNVRGCMIDIRSAGSCGITMCSSAGPVSVNACTSLLSLWGQTNVNISSINYVNITPKAGVNISGEQITIKNSYGPTLTISNSVACFNSNVSVVDSLGQGITINSARISRVFSGRQYDYELPMQNGTFKLTDSAGLKSFTIPTGYYSYLDVSDFVVPVSNDALVGSVTTWRYQHFIHISGNFSSNSYYINVYATPLAAFGSTIIGLTAMAPLTQVFLAGGCYRYGSNVYTVVAMNSNTSGTTIYYM